MGAGGIQLHVDVGERIPGAIGLTGVVDGGWWTRHRCGRPLHRGRDVVAARQRAESSLRRGMAGWGFRTAAPGPSEPFRVSLVVGGRLCPRDVDLEMFLLDHLPGRVLLLLNGPGHWRVRGRGGGRRGGGGCSRRPRLGGAARVVRVRPGPPGSGAGPVWGRGGGSGESTPPPTATPPTP